MSGQGQGVAHCQRAGPAASRVDRTLDWGQRLNHLSRSERKALLLALLASLLAHGLLLGLTFGGQEFGLPGFELPWRERRVAAPDLHLVLAPAPPPAPSPPSPPPSMSTPTEPALPQAGLASPEPVLDRPRFEPPALPVVAVEEPAIAPPEPEPAGDAAVPKPVEAEPERSLGDLGDIPAAQRFHPPLMAVMEPGQARWAAPPVPEVPARAIATAPSAASSPTAAPPKPASAPAEALAQERMRLEQQALAARQRAEELEAARQEQERQEAQRVQAARLAAERAEAERQDRLRQEAAQQELARQEAARLEAERQQAARLQAARQEQERQEAQRQEAARLEAARLEAARLELARQEAARIEAQRQEAARQQAAQIEADEARREAARRAIGRQLDEEAARRDAAAAAAARSPGPLPPATSSLRRGRLLGRADPNAELVLYAEAWARKIQLNVGIEALRELLGRPRANPIVTVALRRDGTVESIVFVVSSGLAELDEAIRRIVQSQAPFQAFSPGLAGDYDVIEIRRTWYFDSAIRLY